MSPPAAPPVADSKPPTTLVPMAAAGVAPRLSAGPSLRLAGASLPHAALGDATHGTADGESSLMVDAVRALRRDRDPARALALAQLALDRYPHGAQVEEATAIGMEAANAEGDSTTARRLAERYLTNFRSGRFADRALQIVSPSR